MKKPLLFLTLACTALSSPMLFAQSTGTTTPPAPTTPSGTSGASGNTATGDRAEKMKAALEQLDLTATQKAQIKQIRANTEPGRERRQQIMAVLTPDQKQKLIAMLKQGPRCAITVAAAVPAAERLKHFRQRR